MRNTSIGKNEPGAAPEGLWVTQGWKRGRGGRRLDEDCDATKSAIGTFRSGDGRLAENHDEEFALVVEENSVERAKPWLADGLNHIGSGRRWAESHGLGPADGSNRISSGRQTDRITQVLAGRRLESHRFWLAGGLNHRSSGWQAPRIT